LITSLCLVLMILPALIWRWRHAPQSEASDFVVGD